MSRRTVKGLVFPECPRWHDGRLWVSDMHAHQVLAVGPAGGTPQLVATTDDMPAGLGFLPDGSLLIVLIRERVVLRLVDGALRVHADLTTLPGSHCNDMVVGPSGDAYVGLRMHPMGQAPAAGGEPDRIVLVRPDGRVEVVADDALSPNGSVLTPDGRTLIVAEPRAHRLMAYAVASDGTLGAGSVYADVGTLVPDGIALDAEGAVWFGSPMTNEFARVRPGGELTHRLPQGEGVWGVACALGGDDRRTLFLVSARCTLELLARLRTPADDATSDAEGWIDAIEVDVPGAGWP